MKANVKKQVVLEVLGINGLTDKFHIYFVDGETMLKATNELEVKVEVAVQDDNDENRWWTRTYNVKWDTNKIWKYGNMYDLGILASKYVVKASEATAERIKQIEKDMLTYILTSKEGRNLQTYSMNKAMQMYKEEADRLGSKSSNFSYANSESKYEYLVNVEDNNKMSK